MTRTMAITLVVEVASRDSRRKMGIFLSGVNEDHKEQRKDKMAHSATKMIRVGGGGCSSRNG
jgi:hypothetical protein